MPTDPQGYPLVAYERISDGQTMFQVLSDGTIVLNTGVEISSGSGSPEGVVTAPVGSLYTDKNGVTPNILYQKQTGSGNTGWVAIGGGGGGAGAVLLNPPAGQTIANHDAAFPNELLLTDIEFPTETLGLNAGYIENHSAYAVGIDLFSHSDTGFRAPVIDLFKSAGTQASPTVPTGILGYLNYGGWDGVSYAVWGGLVAQPSGVISNTNHGMNFYFNTTPANSTTSTIVFWIFNDGTIALGTTGDVGFSRLGAGSMALGNGVAGNTTGKLTLAHLKVTSLQIFANNAAAITGGLAAGDFYRTGADPDVVCVVH